MEPPKTIRLRWRIGHDARTPIVGITDPYRPEVKEQLLTAHADVVGSVLKATQGRVQSLVASKIASMYRPG